MHNVRSLLVCKGTCTCRYMVFDFKIDFKNDEDKNKCMYVQACRFYFKIKPKQNKKTKYIFKV